MNHELTDRQRELLRKQFGLLAHAQQIARIVKSGICLPPNSSGNTWLIPKVGSDEQKIQTALAQIFIRSCPVLSGARSITDGSSA